MTATVEILTLGPFAVTAHILAFIYTQSRGMTMPVYEYECEGCSKVFEVQQRIADKPLTVCPECSGPLR